MNPELIILNEEERLRRHQENEVARAELLAGLARLPHVRRVVEYPHNCYDVFVSAGGRDEVHALVDGLHQTHPQSNFEVWLRATPR